MEKADVRVSKTKINKNGKEWKELCPLCCKIMERCHFNSHASACGKLKFERDVFAKEPASVKNFKSHIKYADNN